MRQAAPQARQYTSTTRSIPAPVDGWNARDSIAAMKESEAVVLDNWFPSTSDIMMRKGSAAHATGLGDEAQTIVVYRPPSGSHEMFAFAGANLYDVSAAGAVGAAEVGSLSNAQWQWENATTTGGNFILAVNGLDDMLLYNGTTWAAVNSGTTPSITNVNTSDLIHLNHHKGRVYYVEKASMSVWYTAVGAITGALTEFNLGSIFRKGGFLMAMGTWTIDGGEGLDDYAVFVTSQGETAVYQGTNPASADTWALVGIYDVGAPIGRRCLSKLGGDLLIITVDGVVPASKAFVAGRSNQAIAMTDRIQGAMASSAELYKSAFGWELTFFADGSMLVLNVPVTDGSHQYVMNTITKRWCRFKGWDANTFEIFNDELYYGLDGEVRKAWTGKSDVGEVIVAEAVSAFAYFGRNTQQKIFRMIRPILAWDSNPAEILVGMDVDFVVNDPTGAVTFTSGSGAVWDTDLWGTGVWGGSAEINRNWYSVTGVGYAGAAHLQVTSDASEVRLSAYDILMEFGGVL